MGNAIEILIVDDDAELINLVDIYLQSEDYIVYKALNAREGLKLLEEHEIKLVIIDTMMPEIDGFEMCRRIRIEKNIPIILLNGKNSDKDVVTGLDAGADDCMQKPFNPLELAARVRALLRRYMELNPNADTKEKTKLQIKNLLLDISRHTVEVDGKPIFLTPLEFDILKLLASHPDKVFSTDEIFETVWNEKIYEANNTVMVHIRRLREKIEVDPKHPKIISTVWGVGYKIEK